MSRYSISRPARRDLADIFRYIAERNPTAAGRLRDIFHESFQMLARGPLLGELRTEFGADIRIFTAGAYVIFYRPAPQGISVVRVIHASRDLHKAWKNA